MKICVVGLGYVGLANAILLAQHNEVVALDIVPEKVEMINKRISPIEDEDIKKYLQKDTINIYATISKKEAYADAKYIIIATPTDYDIETGYFNTVSIENSIKDILEFNAEAIIMIRSTIPLGYIKSIQKQFQKDNILFSPEFLREGKALYDNLYPSRIVVGGNREYSEEFANLLKKGALKQNIPILYTDSNEAEAIKLFSNTYLAMRVAYFNEIDTYAKINDLNTMQVINGVGLDPRIGTHYNNPSFGYGGYCLPKDTQQLLKNFQDVPQSLIGAIVTSNIKRKLFIAEDIIKQQPKIVGIYKLAMKKGSDNFRVSAILDIINILKNNGIKVIIYEPLLKEKEYNQCEIVETLEKLKKQSDIVIANRLSQNLIDIKEKVYTRDVFHHDE